MLKRILPIIFLFSNTVYAQSNGIWIRHPQSDVNYYCYNNMPFQTCVDIACNYATNLGSCRIYSRMPDVVYIETYIPRNISIVNYSTPVVVPPGNGCLWFFLPSVMVIRETNHDRRHNVIHNMKTRSRSNSHVRPSGRPSRRSR